MDARSAVLARIRDALGRSPAGTAAQPARAYRTASDLPPGSPAALDLFVDRLEDYRARAHRTSDLAGTLAEVLAGAGSVVVPPGLEPAWVAGVELAGADVLTDSPPLTNEDLDAAGAVLTAARVAVAETGTIVLDAQPDQGRRAITLVPDHHVCVVRAGQVLATVPEAVTLLAAHPGRPLTWIAGPSATSDIELVRVEGVHGPRTLDVILLEGR